MKTLVKQCSVLTWRQILGLFFICRLTSLTSAQKLVQLQQHIVPQQQQTQQQQQRQRHYQQQLQSRIPKPPPVPTQFRINNNQNEINSNYLNASNRQDQLVSACSGEFDAKSNIRTHASDILKY